MKALIPLAFAALLVTAASAEAQPPAPPAATAAPDPAAFLAQNAKAPGVKTLPSGLQYKIAQSASAGAPAPKAGDLIKVHYEGKLTSGQVFDSSFERGHPAIMPLADLIPGWMVALPMMHVGDEWTLYVPPSLGYGAQAAGPIPANSVLVFRIKLLGMLSAD